MTTYRVGAAGATVFTRDGAVLCRLRPGTVVVEGTIKTRRLPDEHHDVQAKRIARYADKRVRVAEDKHV